jgi:hypothetical protein
MVMFLILFFLFYSFHLVLTKAISFSLSIRYDEYGSDGLTFAAWSFGLLIRLALFWRMGSFSSLHFLSFLSFASLYHFLHLLESSTGLESF